MICVHDGELTDTYFGLFVVLKFSRAPLREQTVCVSHQERTIVNAAHWSRDSIEERSCEKT